jgi:hypothetical protein
LLGRRFRRNVGDARRRRSPAAQGRLRLTGTINCLVAPGTGPATPGMPRANAGFNANLTPIDGGVFSNPGSSEGIYSLDGHGNGTAKWTTVGVNPPPSSNAGSSAVSYSFTYTVNGDGSWKTDSVPGSFIITFLTGGRVGQTATIDKVPLVGLIGEGAKVLTLAAVEPTVETATYSNGDVQPRICHRSRVLVKMQSDDNHGGNGNRN